MIDDAEVVRAKAVLRNAGYYCIPREKVLTVQAEHFIDHLSMCQHGDDPRFIEHLHGQMHRSVGMDMMKARVCRITSRNEDATKAYPGRMGTTYTLRAEMLPYDLISDPMLEFLREKQG